MTRGSLVMRSLALAVATLALLAGCAALPFGDLGLPAGTPRDQVIARAGQPTRATRTSAGERLVYSLQPWGRQAWAVDLDPSGRVTRIEQVLTEQHLARIQPGWTREQVEAEFGPPGHFDRVASWDGPIMNYRWRDRAFVDMWYWVYLDRQGVVRQAHPGVDYPVPGGDADGGPSKD